MGILDTIKDFAQQQGQGNNQPQVQPQEQTRVASGLMQALDEHPGGLQGVMQNFRDNGMEQHVQNWSTGQQSSATSEQVQQGLGGTGLIDSVARKAGVSPQIAKMAMATILPLVMSHFTQGGQTQPPQSGFSGMASQILGKLF
jgi:uncharacterized protein YidB (DUF937 family)